MMSINQPCTLFHQVNKNCQNINKKTLKLIDLYGYLYSNKNIIHGQSNVT